MTRQREISVEVSLTGKFCLLRIMNEDEAFQNHRHEMHGRVGGATHRERANSLDILMAQVNRIVQRIDPPSPFFCKCGKA